MPKFAQLYNTMVKDHQAVFNEFREIHELFKLDRNAHRAAFNTKGKEIMEILREYEDRLCQGMERGQFGVFSDKVSEKFWQRVKKDFSHIEMVGVEILSQ